MSEELVIPEDLRELFEDCEANISSSKCVTTSGFMSSLIKRIARIEGQERTEGMSEELVIPELKIELKAAQNMDWTQVFLNHSYGPPCFHLEPEGRFCGRAKGWHDKTTDKMFHQFTPLASFIKRIARAEATIERLSAPVSDEEGWLIERAGLCLGVECGRPAWVTFTNDGAVHFSRRQDAEMMLMGLRNMEHGNSFNNCVVTGHTWIAARTKKTQGSTNVISQMQVTSTLVNCCPLLPNTHWCPKDCNPIAARAKDQSHCPACASGQSLDAGEGTHLLGTVEHEEEP